MQDNLIGLQAILAGLPIHAVPPPGFARSCGPDILVQCGGQRPQAKEGSPQESPPNQCLNRIEDRLQELWEDYPTYNDVLGRLEVVHACLDLVILADHEEKRLFVAARGTDRMLNPLTTPRDWTNNVRILVGLDPGRTAELVEVYRKVREVFPAYESFGSGHSLGGAVIVHLAKAVEANPKLMFSRIDAFNAAVSPLTRSLGVLTRTAFHAHRVSGDWASWGMSLAAQPPSVAVHTHPVKPHVQERHSLVHFLPEKAASSPNVGSILKHDDSRKRPTLDIFFFNILSCVGMRSKRHPDLPEGRQPESSIGRAQHEVDEEKADDAKVDEAKAQQSLGEQQEIFLDHPSEPPHSCDDGLRA